MFSKRRWLLSSLLFLSFSVFAESKVEKNYSKLKNILLKESLSGEQREKIQNALFKLDNKSVPMLIEVMKSAKFPDQSRWMATMSLARIMGKKSLPFISKFLRHPSWMMRLSSLKIIRMFKDKNYISSVEKLLFDKSLLVRAEALEIVHSLGAKASAKSVWKMLYDKKNYIKFSKSEVQHTDIVEKILKTVVDLDYKKVKPLLNKMASEKKFAKMKKQLELTIDNL